MSTIELQIPTLRAGDWPGAFVEQAELAGAPIWAVTVRTDRVRRRFFALEIDALAWAAGQADSLGVGLFNLADPAGSE